MRRSLTGFLAAVTLLAAPGLFSLPARADETGVIGVWRLVSYLRESPTNGVIVDSEFDDNSGGLLTYNAGGRMSVRLEAGSRISYEGGFTFTGHTIVHHVELSNLPGLVGQDLERSVDISGNRMTLVAEHTYSDSITTLVWERIE